MKINRKHLLLRIISSPVKLVFTLFWFILFSFTKTYQWVIYGGDEIILGKDCDRNTVGELIKEVQLLRENINLK